MAIALCPHFMARLTISLTSETPSISLILVWQCSSMRFSTLVSIRTVVKSAHFLIPTIEPMVSSLSNLSMVATPLTRTNFPPLISFNSSGTSSFPAKILRTIVSVKSVTEKIMMVFSLRISRVSTDRIFPRITTSPIGPSIFSISMLSSSKSLPYITSGFMDFLPLSDSNFRRNSPRFSNFCFGFA